MLYELIAVVRPGNLNEVKEIAKTTGAQILSSGGLVRGITNWGIFRLPQPARKLKSLHHSGHYFIVRFDSSARTQHAVRRTLGLDPRMIRYSVVKVGNTLEEVKGVAGTVEWPGKEGEGRVGGGKGGEKDPLVGTGFEGLFSSKF